MHYDSIPGGKKEARDPKTGKIILVDLECNNFEDLQKMYEEAKAKIEKLEKIIEKLKVKTKVK